MTKVTKSKQIFRNLEYKPLIQNFSCLKYGDMLVASYVQLIGQAHSFGYMSIFYKRKKNFFVTLAKAALERIAKTNQFWILIV